MIKKESLLILIISITLLYVPAVCADPSASPISGRMAASYDSAKGTITAMVAGYCEGQPVTIGPSTWAVSEKHFSNLNAEDVAKTLCGDTFAIRKVMKSVNNGKEMVADVVIIRQ
jgi:hypothetical protein